MENIGEKSLQEIADKLKSFNGNVKGEVFKTHADYIKSKEGPEGIKRLEEKMAELGAPINFSEIKPFEWVNEGMSSLTIIVAKEVFDWTDEDVFEMGRFAPKFSFIIKVLIQYLVSIDSLVENASKYWKKHYDFGSLEKVYYNKEEERAIIREHGFQTHPVVSLYHAGYFKGLCEFALKNKNIEIKETASTYKGDNYNEFEIIWKEKKEE